jgi:hypothetical protein
MPLAARTRRAPRTRRKTSSGLETKTGEDREMDFPLSSFTARRPISASIAVLDPRYRGYSQQSDRIRIA